MSDRRKRLRELWLQWYGDQDPEFAVTSSPSLGGSAGVTMRCTLVTCRYVRLDDETMARWRELLQAFDEAEADIYVHPYMAPITHMEREMAHELRRMLGETEGE